MLRNKLSLIIAAAAAACASIHAAPLVDFGSQWKYTKGEAEASVPAAAWRELSFGDVRWDTGQAPFYYGSTGPDTSGGTIFNDMRNNYLTIFLRKRVMAQDVDQIGGFQVETYCDDGFILWVNGVEIQRFNVPNGEPAYDTRAQQAASEPLTLQTYVSVDAGNALVEGENLIAVQVFNTSPTSSDLFFDVRLTPLVSETVPPVVESVSPAPGELTEFTSLAVRFSEAVTGVEAADLFVNGLPSQFVQGGPDEYVFSFTQPNYGDVVVRFSPDSEIFDLATPPNAFDADDEATRWNYQLVDRTPPEVIEITPRDQAAVRELTAIQVRFSEPVEGVADGALLVNDQAATLVSGTGAGPYLFEFSEPAPGQVSIRWADNHGIRDMSSDGNPLAQQNWTYTLDPDLPETLVLINEIMAANRASSGLRDQDGELQDWIELYNASEDSIDLTGWSLTDDPDDPGRWTLPSRTLPAGGYLVIFASGKDRRPVSGQLHANFRLDVGGDFVGLYNSELPRKQVASLAPEFPEQRNDISYGLGDDGSFWYWPSPTPGAANSGLRLTDALAEPSFSVERGLIWAPFTLRLTSEEAETVIRYTLDGREPTASAGLVYTDAIPISKNTVVRAIAIKEGYLSSKVATHSYIFPEWTLTQPAAPSGFPATWGTYGNFPNGIVPADYEMDPEVVNDGMNRQEILASFNELPVMSITLDVDDMFGAANGIYTHPTTRGDNWERPCSVEFIALDDGGFQIDCGIQIQGNAAREPHKQPKHPMRIQFKGEYGATKLKYQVFPDSPVEEFDTLVLRADFNVSWLHWNATQRVRGQRTRDAWTKDTMRAMGGLASHNRYVHLFINGLYWGIYDPSERPDGSLGAAYLGGEKEDYDVVNEGEVKGGDSSAYNEMLSLSNLGSPAQYARMNELLDMTQFIDYMLLHFYVGHQDWGVNKNWYTLRPRDGSSGFKYMPWDGELVLMDLSDNRVSNSNVPSDLHTKLMANQEYRLAFADRAHKSFFNGGALTPESAAARWIARSEQIKTAIVAESARWGDYRRDVHQYQSAPFQLYTRDNQWQTERNRLLNDYFPRRTDIMLNQLRSAGLYPNVAAPDLSPFGGVTEPGQEVILRAGGAPIYYTVDGTDPRSSGSGAPSAGAARYTDPIVIEHDTVLKARVLSGGTWSALVEAEFRLRDRFPLVVTEVMHDPVGGSAYEFIELLHTGQTALDLSGYYFDGIDYIFPIGASLAPGEVIVLGAGEAATAFAARYPDLAVFGAFGANLSNGGERLDLYGPDGVLRMSFEYDGEWPWPSESERGSRSIELLSAQSNHNLPDHWRVSAAANGTPGIFEEKAVLGPVRIDEILAANIGHTLHNGRYPDWIELVNEGEAPADLTGWRLTDGGNSYAFPDGAALAPGERVVVWLDPGAGEGAEWTAPFALDRDGEAIQLSDAQGSVVDLVSFGPQVADRSMIRSDGGWMLGNPTPGAANDPAAVGDPRSLRINEWLAASGTDESDWVELFNTGQTAIALRGVTLANETTSYTMGSASFIEPRGWVVLVSDSALSRDGLPFRLQAVGGQISATDVDGASIDSVQFGPQETGVTEGRFPDGGSPIQKFPDLPTPGAANGVAPVTDADNDGLPDDWESLYGLNSSDPTDRDLDADGDGATNWEEFIARTSPVDDGDYLRLSWVTNAVEPMRISFGAAANIGYVVEQTSVPQEGGWVELLRFRPATNSRSIEFSVSPASDLSFYRVRVLTQTN